MTIGTVEVYLQPVAYLVELKEQLDVKDVRGNRIGVINVRSYKNGSIT